ncbi:MAG: hypothetical protein FWF41_09680 [Betaproteobacteria bacterium]|nr:hypothetical protein [Betaproteobacteria bacterium]
MNKFFIATITCTILLFVVSSCDSGKEQGSNQTIMSVYKICTERSLEKDRTICFSEDVKEENWKNYGNAIFYLYRNRLDAFNDELAKIKNSNSSWHLAGELEEALFKYNINRADAVFRMFDKTAEDYDALYLNDLKAELLAAKGNWNEVEELVDSLPPDVILNGHNLPFYQACFYLRDQKIEKVFQLIKDLQNNNNDSYDLVSFEYYRQIGDEKEIEKLLKKTKDPSVVLQYGYWQLDKGLRKDAKNAFITAMDMSAHSLDYVVPTAIDMRARGEKDIAEEIMRSQFQYVDRDLYKRYWSDSSYYYLYKAWGAFLSHADKPARHLLDKALSLNPRGLNENRLRYFVCAGSGDKLCQYEALKILHEHDPDNDYIEYLTNDFVRRYPEIRFWDLKVPPLQPLPPLFSFPIYEKQ